MRWLTVVTVLAVIAAAGGFLWWSQQVVPPQPGSEETVAFVVTRNQPAALIIQNLYQAGLVKSPLAARIHLLITGAERKLQAGSFILSPGQSLAQIYQALSGPPADVWVTLPEGWRSEQIASRMAVALEVGRGFSTEDFVTQAATLEGQLFPDTYLIPISATSDRVIQIMTANFVAKSGLQMPGDRQVLVMASLIEREALTDADRPVIAGILWKRLRAGWPLQVDATVQYTQGNKEDWWPNSIDTKRSSAYNTYLNLGLPPAPIANPGLSAINATKNPQDSPYWFYLHTPDGEVYFARTIEEHSANIDKYLGK